LLECIRLFNAAAVDARQSWHPGLGLELAVAESIEANAAHIAPAAHAAPGASSGPAAQSPQTPPQSQGSAPAARAAVTRTAPTAPPDPEDERGGPPPEQGPDSEPRKGDQRKPAARANAATAASNAANAPTGASTAASNAASGAPAPAKTAPRQAAKAEAPTPDPAEEGGARAITQHDVQQNWNRIRQLVNNKNKLSAAALNSCRSVILKESTLILGFQTEVVKSKMETNENIDLLRQAIHSILGVHLSVRCTLVGSKGSTPGDAGVDGDSMVGTALDLGGKIVFED
jgi:DNA polymerase-3 subunit gamma/tau